MKIHRKESRLHRFIFHYFPILVVTIFITIALSFFSYTYYVYHTRESIVLFNFIYILSIISIIIFIVISFREMNMRINMEYLEMQKKAAQRQEKNLRFSQYTMEKQMSDMKQYLLKLDQLLENGNLEGARTICGAFSTSFESTTYKHYCENDTLDVILHGKESECENLGIAFSCKVLVPKEIQIPIPIFISLFFNLLNNGIEGCECSSQAMPFLNLSIDYKGDFLFIHMENSKNPNITFTHRTTKSDTFHHGLGLSIIEEIVRKRQGNCKWMDCGDTFISEIMINFT